MDREQVASEIKELRAKANSQAPKYEGFVCGLDDEIYRSQEGISQSDIKRLISEPFKFFNGIKDEPSPAMIEGTLLHLLLSEPQKLNEKFFITDAERITSAIKEEAEGKLIYKKKDLQILQDCAGYVKSFLIQNLGIDIDKMDGEVSYFGEYEGVKAKGRADKITTDRRAIIDFKKCANASQKEFTRQATNLKYGIQDVFYRELMGVEEFLWVAIETKPLKDKMGKHHFMIGVYKSSELMLEQGKKLIDLGLGILKNPKNFDLPIYPSENIQNDLDFGKSIIKELTPPLWSMI